MSRKEGNYCLDLVTFRQSQHARETVDRNRQVPAGTQHSKEPSTNGSKSVEEINTTNGHHGSSKTRAPVARR